MERAVLDETPRAYFVGFVAVLIGCFTPFKALAYLLPGAFTVWIALHGGAQRDRILLLLFVIAAGAVAYDLLVREFLVVNYLVAVVTYSSIIPVLVIDARTIASHQLLARMLRVMPIMIVVQGAIGIVQAVAGAARSGTFSGDNGDHVAGTIYPHLDAEHAFSNPMFAVNMAMMLLVCISLPALRTGRDRGYLIVGGISLVLASVLHVLVFLIAAVVVAVVVLNVPNQATAPRMPRGRLTLLIVAIAAFSYVALPENVASITHVAETAFDLDAIDVPRAIMLGRVITDLPEEDPVQPYVGLGPGQFSSRASLIMSGVYLGGEDDPKSLPFVTPQVTRLTRDYCISLMLAARDAEADVGSSQQPFFSWLTVYTETGVIGLCLVFGSVAALLIRVRRRTVERPAVKPLAVTFCAGVLLLVFLGWQADYWEVPQAILVGLLLMKVLYAHIMYGEDDAHVRD